MPASNLALVRNFLDGADGMATETANGFYDLLPLCRITSGSSCRQRLRLRICPQEFGDRIDFCSVSIVPIRTAAIIAVPPELRHARLGLEVFGVCKPLANPVFREFSGDR